MKAKPPEQAPEGGQPPSISEWFTGKDKATIALALTVTVGFFGLFTALAQVIDYLNNKKGILLLIALVTTLIVTSFIVLLIILPKRAQLTVTVKAIALVSVTFLGSWAIFYAVYTAVSQPPGPAIIQPRDGSAYPTDVSYIDVKGTAPLKLESGSELRIIVEALDQSSWYPLGQLVSTRDGNWQTQVGIGPSDPSKVNRTLEFRVVLAECSREAVIRIEQARANPAFNNEGMQPLEMGVKKLAGVVVKRLGPSP